MPTYFMYCRKSSEAEDRQILSIDSQITELKRYAARKGLKIAAVLTEAKSAKAPGHTGAAGAHAGGQVLRSPAALSAGADPGPPPRD